MRSRATLVVSTLWGVMEVGEAGDDHIKPKHRETCSLGNRYVVFIYFVLFYMWFILYIGSIYAFKGRRGLVRPTTTITSPNDASNIVWELGPCFFLDFIFSLYYLMYMTTHTPLYRGESDSGVSDLFIYSNHGRLPPLGISFMHLSSIPWHTSMLLNYYLWSLEIIYKKH